jgi:hypothetical protein
MSRKFLIGQLACFGDCLYATTIAKQIKFDYPESHVTWAIATKYKSILELNPYIDSIWEIEITDGDYYGKGWKKFENAAISRKKKGDFDEIIFSQIYPLNWINYYKTIRNTILSAYKKPIKVPVTPVLRLSTKEVENVKSFAEKNSIQQFKNIVLFECNAGSGQSTINTEHAIEISKKIIEYNDEVCFILTTHKKINVNTTQIIDASELTFRENAELTKYCTLLIGCSSGITWLSTSDWARKLPMLQLLDSKSFFFAGVHFDFEVNKLDNSNVIELIEFDFNKICECVLSLLTEDFSKIKKLFHQNYKPSSDYLYRFSEDLINKKYNILNVIRFACCFIGYNSKHKNKIKINYIDYFNFLFKTYKTKNYPIINLKNTLKRSLKFILKKIH